MINNRPITPPPERFKQWEDDILNERDNVDHVLDCAWKDGFLAGADQELKECLMYASDNGFSITRMSAARRPKLPSLKEQALKALNSFEGFTGSLEEVDTIRRALEALPND